MRNFEEELQARLAFLRQALARSGAKGFVFGNSGGKDSALVGILCRKACENTLGVLLPCHSRRNYEQDRADALALAGQYGISTRTVDLTATRAALLSALGGEASLPESARANIAPRLRMAALYALAASENLLVAGTGNRSERHMGYFTKWGDGACDVNPIADLTVREVYAFLRRLGAPEAILTKAPSAGLYEGQTDEGEMGVTYAAIDAFLETGRANDQDLAVIKGYHARSEHKRRLPLLYGEE